MRRSCFRARLPTAPLTESDGVFRPFRDASSARSGAADAERPRLGAFMLILIIYLYYTEYFILCDVVSCGRHARSDGTFMRLFGRYRRLPNAAVRAWRRRGGHGARYRAKDERRKRSEKSTRTASRVGDWLFIGGVIYAAVDIRIRGKRLNAHGFAADVRRHIFCRSAWFAVLSVRAGAFLARSCAASRMAVMFFWYNKSMAPGPFLWLRGVILRF